MRLPLASHTLRNNGVQAEARQNHYPGDHRGKTTHGKSINASWHRRAVAEPALEAPRDARRQDEAPVLRRPADRGGAWAYRYSFGGLSQKLTLGPYPAIGLAKARALAANAAAALADGRNPGAEKAEAKVAAKAKAVAEAAPTDLVDDVAHAFVEHAKRRTRLRSWGETERILRREIIPAWGKRRLSTITKAEVHALLDAIADRRAPILANRTLAHLKTMGRWACDREIVAVNPFADVRPPAPETTRERVLDDREISALMAVLDAEPYPFGPFTRLLLMLGARRSEIAGLRWSELDFVKREWKLPKERSKNRAAHTLPLPDAVIDILKALPRIERSDLVFTLDGRRPITAVAPAKVRISRAMEAALGEPVPTWTYHDLRRTCATGLASIGVPPHVCEAVLNHKGGVIRGVAQIYNRFSYRGEQLSALEAWARRLDEIVSGKTAGNVVAFEKARG